jgi:hypothetical protein
MKHTLITGIALLLCMGNTLAQNTQRKEQRIRPMNNTASKKHNGKP